MSETVTAEKPTITIENEPEFKAPAVATSAYTPPAIADEAAPLRMVLGTYLTNPEVSTEKVEFVLKAIERAQNRMSERLFQDAFARAQRKFTRAAKNRVVKYDGKDGKADRNTPYADWHSHWEAVGEHLNAEGLAVWFGIDATPGQPVTVTAYLEGYGHTREVKVTLLHDGGAGKNAAQAEGSAIMYGRRYTGCAILNLTVQDDQTDDDGKGAGISDGAPITQMQAVAIISRLEEHGIPVAGFCKAAKVEKVEDLLAVNYDRALEIIDKSVQRKKAAEANTGTNVKF